MGLELKDLAKDPKLLALLKSFMVSEHNSENYDFLFAKDSNDKLYAKYISATSSTQVNLPSTTQSKLDELAAKKKWSDMSTLLATARTQITSLVNTDVLPRFLRSKPYLDYLAATAPDLTKAKAAVSKMEADLAEGSTFLTTALANVRAKGKPADREEVNRMFDSARMRHDKVHVPFTELLQKDKAFTKERFAAFFSKKDAFSKQWAEYRKLLGR